MALSFAEKKQTKSPANPVNLQPETMWSDESRGGGGQRKKEKRGGDGIGRVNKSEMQHGKYIISQWKYWCHKLNL